MISDPLGQFFGSFSQDRSIRVYKCVSFKTSKTAKLSKVISRVVWHKKEILPSLNSDSQNSSSLGNSKIVEEISEPSEQEPQAEKKFLFIDSNKINAIFQRADWSPCGWFFLAPSGQLDIDKTEENLQGAHLFSRSDLKRPLLFYPSDQPIILARFSKALYSFKGLNQEVNSVFDLGYHLAFLLTSYSKISLYSTKSQSPLYSLENIHYAGLSDIAWHHSGRLFSVSSLDGFLTFCSVDKESIGNVIGTEESSNLIPNNVYLKLKHEAFVARKEGKNLVPQNNSFSKVNKVSFVRKIKPKISSKILVEDK